jgi:hypothetical protein
LNTYAGVSCNTGTARIFIGSCAYQQTNHRHTIEQYAGAEDAENKTASQESFVAEVDSWAQELHNHAWIATQEPDNEGEDIWHAQFIPFNITLFPAECPKLVYTSNSFANTPPKLPASENITQLLNTILFLQVTQAKMYSAHSRITLWSCASLDEDAVVYTLKNPKETVEETELKTKNVKDKYAEKGKKRRKVAKMAGAVAGGTLVGVTGGKYNVLKCDIVLIILCSRKVLPRLRLAAP